MLQKSKVSIADNVGCLYFGDQKIFRAIFPGQEDAALELLRSGLIDELIEAGLFPSTSISERQIEGHELVLEHQKIEPLTYPFEWSPEMIRRAALAVLEVNRIANSHGYELRDAHPYNVVFNDSHPLWVDFGSFQKRHHDYAWSARNEFDRSFTYVLKLFSKGYRQAPRLPFLKAGALVPHQEYYLATNGLFRALPRKLRNKALKAFLIYRTLYAKNLEKLRARFFPLGVILAFLARRKWLPFVRHDHQKLKRKISGIKLNSNTIWGSYHKDASFYDDSGNIKLTKRMTRVVDFVKTRKPKSILELAGNQGVLSIEMSRIEGVQSVICTDLDDSAVDQLVRNLEKFDVDVTPAVLDFMLPAANGNLAHPIDRFRSEMVVALAVTHHLLLTQNFRLDAIVDSLAEYTERYLITEFMPLGLWDGTFAPPLPDWYSEEWFVEGLSRKFRILEKISVEENRVMFMAEKLGE